jgi:2-oxo-4-hydroxy-4-carboxy-5-ureidoimidazoline decarboxylase
VKLEMNLQELNSLPEADFISVLGGIFEHSPWVAEAVAGDRPFTSVSALHQAMVQAVEKAGGQAVDADPGAS